MLWNYNLFSLPLLVTAIVAAALAVYAWRRRAIPGGAAFAVLMAAVAEWSFSYALELGSTSLPLKLFWARVEYFGILAIPATWLIFSLQYTGLRQKPERRTLTLLAIMPALTILMVWTNDLHGLIWSGIQFEEGGFDPAIRFHYGSGFWVHTTYSYLLVTAGMLAIFRFFLHAQRLYRPQVRIVLAAMCVAWAINAFYVFKISPIPNLDLTPFAFAITVFLGALSFLRLQFLNVVPLARGAIVESMRDAVIVLDAGNRIADFNPAAEAITRRKTSEVIGKPASQVFADYPEWISRFGATSEACEVLVGGEAEALQYYRLQISPLYDRVGRFTGRLVVLQDITEQERAKLALQQSNQELDGRVQERTIELKKEIVERKSIEQELRERVEMERMVANISTNFINRTVDELDQEINRTLQTIGEFAGVDRSYIFRLSADGATISNTHEWSAPGIPAQKEHLSHIPCTSLPWWMGRLNRREAIHIPRQATLPQPARVEKEILRSKDTHSLVAVPLTYGNALTGFLGFDSSQKEKVWAEEDMALLRLVGEILANALVRKDTEEALRASDAELRAVFSAMNDQVLVCDRTGRILKIAPTHPSAQHLPAKALSGKRLDQILPAETAASILAHIQEALAEQKTSQVDYSLEIHGQPLWFSGAISPIQGDRVVLVARDITERKASEEQLIYKALHDALTGLPNRRLLMERLERACERSKRYPKEMAAVLYLDLDGFKAINDSLGHPTGDQFLITVARLLKTCMRASDTVARLGGDEFAALLEDIEDLEEAIRIAKRIQEIACAPVELEGQQVSVSASIGIALVSPDYIHPEEILRDADQAMYQAKANGKGRHVIFTAGVSCLLPVIPDQIPVIGGPS